MGRGDEYKNNTVSKGVTCDFIFDCVTLRDRVTIGVLVALLAANLD